MDEAECKNEPTLERLKALRQNDDVVVLSLGTLASFALRKTGIPYVTPDLFFSKEKAAAMDKQALAFAMGWYKSIDDPVMTFHGVSIGEVLEYDFYFLFIDALRSVEIAKGLLRDSFDALFVSSQDFPEVGHAACYNTLPSILTYIANQKGMKVIRHEQGSRIAVETVWKSNRVMHRFSLVFHNHVLPTINTTFSRGNFGTLVSFFLHRNMKRIALAFHDDGVVDSLRDKNGRGLKIFPSFLHTPGSISQVKKLLMHVRDAISSSGFDDSIMYDDIPFSRVLLPFFNQILSKSGQSVIGRIQWTELFLKMFRPASFVVIEDISPLLRSMCQVLRLHGIPVVVVQHGILANDFAGFYIMPKVGDFQAVWGEYYKTWHTDRGKSDESQVVTGFPRHDRLLNLPPLNRDGLCKRFGLNPRMRVVLIATEWFQSVSCRRTIEEDESYIRHVLRSLKAYDDIQVVVKLHPGFQDLWYKIVSQIAEQERVRVVIAKDSLWDLIRLSSFVIVSVSSVCVEALILGKQVISVDLNDCKDITGLVQDGLATGAYSADEISRSIRICTDVAEQNGLQDDSKTMSLFPFVYLIDGCASKRVAELIRAVSIQSQTSHR